MGSPDAVLPKRSLNLAIIANPFSGGGQGRATTERISAILKERGHNLDGRVHFTNAPGHAIVLGAAVALDAGVDAVLVVGGDGTSHEAINGLAIGALFGGAIGSGVHLPPVVLTPCGSGNTVAFGLGIRTWEDSLKALESRCCWYTDLVEISKPEDVSVLPRLSAPSGGGGPRRLASPVSLAGSGAPSAAVAAASTSLDAPTIAAIQRRLLFSFNMIGHALSTSVMKRANDLRWMGSAQYNLGALLEVVGNKSYLSCLQVIEPAEGLLPITADALEQARGELAAARAGLQLKGKGGAPFAGFITGSSNPVAEAAATSGSSVSASSSSPSDAVVTVSGATGSAEAATSAPSSTSAAATTPTHLTSSSSSSSLLRAAETLPTGVPVPLLMLQIQPIAYMGSKMSFCPLSRCNDGLMDIAAVATPLGRLECVALMDAAKLQGEHVLGNKVPAAETSVLPAGSLAPSSSGSSVSGSASDVTPSEASSATGSSSSSSSGATASLQQHGKASGRTGGNGQYGPGKGMRYCQAKEVIFRPLSTEETQRWLQGENAELPPAPLPLPVASDASSSATAATSPADAAEKAAAFLRLCLANGASAAEASPFPALTFSPAPSDAAALKALKKERKALNIAPEGMIGAGSVNVDGELSGFSPARLRMLQRVLPLVCNPQWQGQH